MQHRRLAHTFALWVFAYQKRVQQSTIRCYTCNPAVGKLGDTLNAASSRRVCVVESEFSLEAKSLAKRLSLPLVADEGGFTHRLSFVPYEVCGLVDHALSIQILSDVDDSGTRKRRSQTRKAMKPYFIDLCPPLSSTMGKRTQGATGSDLLLKAVFPRSLARAVKEGKCDAPVVYDLTAGFGQDALIMATGGARKVHMVERDPVVAALLQDAMRRLHLLSGVEESEFYPNVEVAKFLADRLTLQVGEAVDVASVLPLAGSQPDIIYLDPMFPPRRKSASVKKGMQILHGLLSSQQGNDENSECELLNAAYHGTKNRLVVKRPSRAPSLGAGVNSSLRPSSSVDGSVNRWDIYVK